MICIHYDTNTNSAALKEKKLIVYVKNMWNIDMVLKLRFIKNFNTLNYFVIQ